MAWTVLFFPQLFLGQVCTLGDASTFRPFADFSRARWNAEHVRTYWNPYTFMGTEAVASLSDSRPQYLPGAALDVVERLSQPRVSPQLWLLLAHLLGTLAVMALARRLWHARGAGALCGGLIWLLAVPILLPFSFGHDAQLLADALIPVAALFVHRLVSARGARRTVLDVLGLSATLAVQALQGHPQIVVYTWMFLGVFAVQQALSARAPARLIWVTAACALGVALSMAVWWPALLYSGHSFRGGGATLGLSLHEVEKFSLGWRDLSSLVWPRAVGYGGASYWGAMHVTDYSPYLGAVAVTLAVLGWGAWTAQRSTGILLAWVVAVAVVLSLGTTLGPIYGLVRGVIPFWSKFRVPFYLLVLAVLSLALLAARGVSRVLTPASSLTPIANRLLGAAAALGAIVGLALTFAPLQRLYAAHAQDLKPTLSPSVALDAARLSGIDLLLRLGLVVATVVVARHRSMLRWRHAVWVLPLLVAVDLGSVAYPTLSLSTESAAAAQAARATPLAEVTAADPHARAYVGVGKLFDDRYAEAYTNFWVSWHARCLTGLAGAPTDNWRPALRFDLVRRKPALMAWGVTYLDLPAQIHPDSLSLRKVMERDSVSVYAFRNPLGRAYVVRNVVALPDEDAVAEAMTTAEFDPRRVAVTTAASAAGEYPGSEGCTLHWLRDEPENIVLDADAPDRAFLVVADSYFPGWTASVDGRAVEIVPANLLVRGVAVPSGRHRIEMRYEAAGMQLGVLATRTSGALWSMLLSIWLIVEVRGRLRGAALTVPR